MNSRSAKQTWDAALGELQLQVSRANYETWLKDTVGLTCRDGFFLVGAPTSFATEWLQKRLHSLIRKTLLGISGEPLDVRFTVYQSQDGGEEDKPTDLPFLTNASKNRRGNRNSKRVSNPHKPSYASHLNPKYTFDSFIVGSCNRLAHAASLSAAEKPGRSYNPLFIYGGVGLGKTHILHAIGHRALQDGLRIIYVSSEQFTNEFINSIRERSSEEFRGKYRNTELLLIDDIHFIAGKEQTQEEFFHTFNDLHSADHQIVLCSDRHPKSMPLLEDRLRSRFEWGLIADIQPPDLETRLAILQAKAREQGTLVPGEVLELIANRVQSNIRELEGSLNRVLAYAKLAGDPLTVEVAARELADLSLETGRRRKISPTLIVETIAKYFNLSPQALRGARRDREIVQARQITMFILREDIQLPLTAIGRELGQRDHSTVVHGCAKIGSAANVDGQLRRSIAEIRESLYREVGLVST